MNSVLLTQLKQECPRLADFLGDHPELLAQRVFQGFLEHPEYRRIFVQAICIPDIHSLNALNDAFQKHYTNVQFTQYISKTLYWTAIHFDQNHREHHDKQSLLPDKPENMPQYQSKDDPDVITETSDIQSWSADADLTGALLQLPQKQQSLIRELYGNDRTNSEIARLWNVSQQAVSRMHLHALHRMRTSLKREWNE